MVKKSTRFATLLASAVLVLMLLPMLMLASCKKAADTASDNPFADVDTATPHAEDILWLAQKGISTGWEEADGTRTFRPYDDVTRGDLAAFLYRLAGSPNYKPSADDKAYFSDVDESTPHAKEIWWLASRGISKGWEEADGTHTFRPDDNVTRADLAAFLYRLAGEPAYKPTSAEKRYYSDISSSSPHANEIWWMASVGISKGFEESNGNHAFHPDENVTRADMAAFLHRMDEKNLVAKTK